MPFLEYNDYGVIEKHSLEECINHMIKQNYVRNLTTFEDEYGFNREWEFKVDDSDNKYRIEWYKNMCTLYLNRGTTKNNTVTAEMLVRFKKMTIKNTWPIGSKKQLQLYKDGNIVSVLRLQTY